MIHPDTELRFKDPTIGWGVFATRPIPQGTIVWTLCELDRRLSPAWRTALMPPCRQLLDRYTYVDAAGDFILCWDHGRYVNHSCDPAMLGIGSDVEIAVRDLAPGDELTCEYGTLNLPEPLPCRCGAPGCRGTIGETDLLQLWPDLDRRALSALAYAAQVPQPLLPYLRDKQSWLGWVQGKLPLPSSRDYLQVKP
ncbi:MAG: SET domain-containing protein-lysine N-methyltransferase [Desulfuromonadales bacterium]|nr:SET domain-containing protein-lysine N-methyltransferase [Desulfuromonadales bacterium]